MKLFIKKEYLVSKNLYSEALKIKPTEKYPSNKISEINNLLASKELDNNYSNKLKKADALLANKDLEAAKSSYQEASIIKPAETYPKSKILEINNQLKLLSQLKAIEVDYNNRIEQADAAFSSKELENAKMHYLAALNIKSKESYPKEKIKEIDATLASLASAAEKNKLYDERIKEGDRELSTKKYEAAKLAYESALAIKEGEQYPKDKIAEIAAAQKLVADKKAIEENYNKTIAQADKLFAQKEYQTAKAKYNAASQIKKEEAYPKTKIAEIDQLLGDIADIAAKDKQYQELISSANQSFENKDYQTAKENYNSASKLKPNEAFPKQRLEEITSAIAILANAKAKEEKYNAKIKLADQAIANKEYELAKTNYLAALNIKSKESYPREKIKEIDATLASLASAAEKNKLYDERIKKGDRELSTRKYEAAKLAYESALAIKEDEQYPKDKITEIAAAQKLVADKEANKNAEKEKQIAEYKKFISEANSKFSSKEYLESKILYQKAQLINPKSIFPKDKIKEIDSILLIASRRGQALDKKKKDYQALINSADKALSSKDYSSAKVDYKKASSIMPNQAYPKNKLKEISKLTAAKSDIPDEINFNNKAEKKKFISTMAAKYGEGIHEEKYENKARKKVRRSIVVKNGLAGEYREVKQPWGATYYFKNGKIISRPIFTKETKK